MGVVVLFPLDAQFKTTRPETAHLSLNFWRAELPYPATPYQLKQTVSAPQTVVYSTVVGWLAVWNNSILFLISIMYSMLVLRNYEELQISAQANRFVIQE